jgi:hypothetical protein
MFKMSASGKSLSTTELRYLPGTHASHLVIPSPEKPALQVQPFTDALPGIELAFPAHNLQLELPGISWYVPTWHVVQDEAPEASAYVPAGHSVQFDKRTDSVPVSK